MRNWQRYLFQNNSFLLKVIIIYLRILFLLKITMMMNLNVKLFESILLMDLIFYFAIFSNYLVALFSLYFLCLVYSNLVWIFNFVYLENGWLIMGVLPDLNFLLVRLKLFYICYSLKLLFYHQPEKTSQGFLTISWSSGVDLKLKLNISYGLIGIVYFVK